MKNFITLSINLLFVGLLFGQNCNDLIVSEIVFGTPSPNVAGQQVTQFNHSIEVFNPTDSPIDLSNYKIELIPETGLKTTIQLDGLVPSKDVFVISNLTANSGISSVSDVLDLLLSFEGKVAIQLTKNTGEVIDKLGKQGVDVTSTAIDFTALLSDPNYLDGLDINLGSIENLLIRRKRIVQAGKEDFTNEDFKTEWVIYPNFAITDLGNHKNACVAPVLSWDGWNQFAFEDWRFESEEFNPVYGTIVLSQPATNNITIFIENVGAQYIPGNPPAFATFDFLTPIVPTQNITIVGGETSATFELLTPIDDNNSDEGDEGTGFQFDIVSDGGTDAMIEFQGDLFDIQIREILTASSDINISSQINVFPTIVSNTLNIMSTDPDLKMYKVKLIGIDSRFVTHFDLSSTSIASLDLSKIPGLGYYILAIKTNKGIAIKRIFKH